MNGDWLDRLAVRAVRGRPDDKERVDAPSVDDERLSRAAAVKLAIAGAASVSLGLWRIAPANADEFGDCLAGCYGDVEKWLDNQLNACGRVFLREGFGELPGWRRALEAGFIPVTTIQVLLWEACALAALNKARGKESDCGPRCKKKCRKAQARSLQSTGSSRQVCEPPPPPKPEKPYTPPPPKMTEDPCWACNQVGGQCCGPFTPGADGRFVPCACATVGVSGGCMRYGCGG